MNVFERDMDRIVPSKHVLCIVAKILQNRRVGAALHASDTGLHIVTVACGK